jgi:hypothetical protein
MFLLVLALFCLVPLAPAHAQSAPCGLTSIEETTPLLYPPIARVAQISREVVALVRFAPDGSGESVRYVSGPAMLQDTTRMYFKGLRANPYTGPRECPMVVSFNLVGASGIECGSGNENKPPATPLLRTDLQHVSITRERGCFNTTSDPAGHIIHHFLFLRWQSKQ